MAWRSNTHKKNGSLGSPAGPPSCGWPQPVAQNASCPLVEPREEKPWGDHSRWVSPPVGISGLASSDVSTSPAKGPSVAGSGSLPPTWCRRGNSSRGATSTNGVSSTRGGPGPWAGWVGQTDRKRLGSGSPEANDPAAPSPTSFHRALHDGVTRPSLCASGRRTLLLPGRFGRSPAWARCWASSSRLCCAELQQLGPRCGSENQGPPQVRSWNVSWDQLGSPLSLSHQGDP